MQYMIPTLNPAYQIGRFGGGIFIPAMALAKGHFTTI